MARLLKLPEVAQRLEVSEKTARRYVKAGVLPSAFVGNAYRVNEEDVEEYLRRAKVEVGGDTPKGPARRPLEDQAVGAGVSGGPAMAAVRLAGVIGRAADLSAGWTQDVKLYAQDGRAVPSYRTFEMSCAVNVLYQQYFDAVEVLQRDAIKQGLDPDVATWDAPSKQRLIDSGSAVRALAELYDLIARSSASAEEDRGNLQDFQARLEEFDTGLPAFLAQDPAWNEAVEKSRAAAGLT